MRNVAKLVVGLVVLASWAPAARADWGAPYNPHGVKPPRLSFWSKPYFAQKARRDQARWNQMWEEYHRSMEAYQKQASLMPRPVQQVGYPMHTGTPVVYQPYFAPHATTIQVMPAAAETAGPKGVATVTDRK